MKKFANLFTALDQTTKTNKKVEALVNYLNIADDSDRLWAVALLSHRRPRRTVNTTLLRQWAAEYAQLPTWLFEESYHVVGDLAETIALLLPQREEDSDESLTHWVEFIQSLGNLEEADKKQKIRTAWAMLDTQERFVFNKLITGGFRIGVSQKLMVRALSKQTGIEESNLAHRLMGKWTPNDSTFHDLIYSESTLDDSSKPYPFYLAYALEDEPQSLGAPEEWQAERKWDGIRGQLIKRDGQIFVWSRGEELVTDKFPEYQSLLGGLPDGTVIDGEILPFKDGRPLPFGLLQTRIGRKNVTKGVLQKAPVILMAYDLLEWAGEDIRQQSIRERRIVLEKLVAEVNHSVLQISPKVSFNNWESLRTARSESRAHYSEGIMLKRLNSDYKAGRKRGDWWKWKVDPLVVDAVMIYAQRGHGRRANLFTDFTFAVWDEDKLVPFTKAYSGLTDAEFKMITSWVRKNTVERFGPVRSVVPTYVFEIAFEGINASSRHKSGVALRFPRISRWRKDKPIEEANTLEDLKVLLNQYGNQ